MPNYIRSGLAQFINKKIFLTAIILQYRRTFNGSAGLDSVLVKLERFPCKRWDKLTEEIVWSAGGMKTDYQLPKAFCRHIPTSVVVTTLGRSNQIYNNTQRYTAGHHLHNVTRTYKPCLKNILSLNIFLRHTTPSYPPDSHSVSAVTRLLSNH